MVSLNGSGNSLNLKKVASGVNCPPEDNSTQFCGHCDFCIKREFTEQVLLRSQIGMSTPKLSQHKKDPKVSRRAETNP